MKAYFLLNFWNGSWKPWDKFEKCNFSSASPLCSWAFSFHLLIYPGGLIYPGFRYNLNMFSNLHLLLRLLPFRPIYFSYLKLSLTGTELFLPYPHKIQNKLCLLQCFFVLFFISQQHQHPSFSFQSSLTSSLLSHIEPQSLFESTSE